MHKILYNVSVIGVRHSPQNASKVLESSGYGDEDQEQYHPSSFLTCPRLELKWSFFESHFELDRFQVVMDTKNKSMIRTIFMYNIHPPVVPGI